MKSETLTRITARMPWCMALALCLTLAALAAPALAQPPAQAPHNFEWQTATPESQGMSSQKLEALKNVMIKKKTRALLIIRNDKIVLEWYAADNTASTTQGTASLAKALVGGMSLAVAMSDGRIALDDPAAKFIPQWKNDPRKSKILIRHLGSHTSGLDDAETDGMKHEDQPGWKGDFWKRPAPPRDPFTLARDETPMIFEPGEKIQYSNPGIGLMTYCVTAAIKDTEDKEIRSLLRDRVMRPIGAADEEWSVGYDKPSVVDGLTLYGSWGGAAFTPRAAARIGRLVLRQGDWEGRRILTPEAVHAVTTDAGQPGHCGMGWWSNNGGRYAGLPRDATYGAGANDQLMMVIPSLNLIMVRNGRSIEPDPDEPPVHKVDMLTSYHDYRAQVLFEPLVDAVLDRPKPAAAAPAVAAPTGPVAPGKFIPTFAVKYGNANGWPALEDAARFDLIVSGSGASRLKAHPTIPGSTWQVLKHLKPRLPILLYVIGPAEYNIADWGRLGDGWDWIKTHHGIGSQDRWTALGATYGTYLQAKPYAGERMMLPGNPAWQQYWLDSVYAKFWGDPAKPTAIADGIFSDNTRYSMIWQGEWLREGHPDSPDVSAEYYAQGKPDLAQYHRDMTSFFRRDFPWWTARGKKLALNFGGMARESATWMELDNEPSAPFVAMEEGAFITPWSARKNVFVFYPEKDWLTQVETMRKLKHVRPLMNVHGPVVSEEQDITRMNASDGDGVRAWDALWFALTSFLQGYDDVRQNAYLNFTLWGYTKFYLLPEFMPERLHLGRARGEYKKVEGKTGHVYMREFDDGWAVVNPADKPAAGIDVPSGEARVVDHDTLTEPDTRPLVKRFSLPARRGVILLKAGHAIGNSDNQ